MSDVETLVRNERPSTRKIATQLVDCDIHPLFPPAEIYKRMPRKSLRHVLGSGTAGGSAREHNRNPHPTHALRLDAVPPSGGLPGSDPDFMISDFLDRYDVSAALMSPLQAGTVIPWGDDESACHYLSALNDYFLEEWHGRDRRYRVLISVSPHDADAAVKEIERLADRPGVSGINIPLAEVSLGRSSMTKLYEAAAHHRLPLVLHPTGAEGNYSSGPHFAGGNNRTYPAHHGALGQSGVAAAVALGFSGVLARLPDLRVVFAEFGFSWVAPMLWRMDTAWHRTGDAEEGGLPPSHYILRQMRFTTQPYDEPTHNSDLLLLLDAMQAEKTLLFSSDYPHWDNDDPIVVLKGRLPEKLRNAVAFESAIDTFGDRLWR